MEIFLSLFSSCDVDYPSVDQQVDRPPSHQHGFTYWIARDGPQTLSKWVRKQLRLLENSCGTADRMLGGGDAKYIWCQDVGLSEIANTGPQTEYQSKFLLPSSKYKSTF